MREETLERLAKIFSDGRIDYMLPRVKGDKDLVAVLNTIRAYKMAGAKRNDNYLRM